MSDKNRSKHSPRITPEQYRELLRRKLKGDSAAMNSDAQVMGDIAANDLELAGGLPTDMSNVNPMAMGRPGMPPGGGGASMVRSQPMGVRMGVLPGIGQPPNAPSPQSFRRVMDMMPGYQEAAAPGRDPNIEMLMQRMMQRTQNDPMAAMARQRAALPQTAPVNVDQIMRDIYARSK